MKLWMLAPIAAGVIVAVIVAISFSSLQPPSPSVTASSGVETPKPLVPLEKIVSGGPPKDGIPSIDDPKFVRAADASFMQDGDIVIGLSHGGVTKAYPLKILVWHEIVNDEIAGMPVAVTYCPLCFTSLVFERVIDGQVVEFGTSGKLYNSNLVMYDRLSDSYWSQAMAKGIAGRYSGHELKKIPFDLAYWKEWKQLNPDSLVLSTDTGSARPYGTDPYGDYYTSPGIFFPVEHSDGRLGPKEIVMGLEYGNDLSAYRLDDITKKKLVNDSVGNNEVLLLSLQPFMARAYDRTVEGTELEFHLEDGKVKDVQTGSEWNFDGLAVSGPMMGRQLDRLVLEPSFWFSWYTFHPDTELYNVG